ncbi:cytochrome P450 family protein [Kitasatospora sp. HPMI-4]|uniref:cytochrome P450 family protein n=1 Tax=Kitasatospora sp. HPMI-4 TaxID=3448443 RepID=UPI003F19EFD6
MATTLPEPAPATVGVTELLQDLYGGYAALRATAPVQRITGPDGLPFWLVTRYQDVRELLADPRLSIDKRNALPGNYRGLALPPTLDANLLNMDPPDHTRIRRLVSQAFTPRRVERLRAPIQRTADDLLDRIAPLGRADLVADYAGPFPIAVICDLLGVRPEDRRDFRAWTDAVITPDPARPERARAALADMLEFLTRLIARKRAEPGEDLLSAMITARDEGDRLSEDELTSLAFLILFAGYENTVQLIGNSVLALLDHPEQLAELRRDPALLPAAVEELTRYDTPAPLAIRRFPLEDLIIGDVTIPAGETVLLSLGSANRDPGHYEQPDRLDLHRRDSAHLSLGHGIHYCVGAPLARMETGIAIATLLRRFPDLALDIPRETVRRRPSIRARGLLALPVRF